MVIERLVLSSLLQICISCHKLIFKNIKIPFASNGCTSNHQRHTIHDFIYNRNTTYYSVNRILFQFVDVCINYIDILLFVLSDIQSLV